MKTTADESELELMEEMNKVEQEESDAEMGYLEEISKKHEELVPTMA